MTIRLSQTLEAPETDHTAVYLARLRRHTTAVRENQDVVLAILSYLAEDPPNASAASECLSECSNEVEIDLWSSSTKAGGIWQTWQRDAMKYGDITTTNSYNVYRQRRGLPEIRN